jgi:hypothetical protein
MSTDSFTLTENEDGSLTISWDTNDPAYAMFNDLTEEEISAMLMEAIMNASNESVYGDGNESDVTQSGA